MNNYLPAYNKWEDFLVQIKEESENFTDNKSTKEIDWAYQYLKDIRANLAEIFSFADTTQNNTSLPSLISLAYLQVNSLVLLVQQVETVLDKNKKNKTTETNKNARAIAHLWVTGGKYLANSLALHLAEGEQELLDKEIAVPLTVRPATRFLGEQSLLSDMYTIAIGRDDLAASWKRYIEQEVSFSAEQQRTLIHHGQMLKDISLLLFNALPLGEKGEKEHAQAWGAFYYHIKTTWSLLNVLNILKNENREGGSGLTIEADQITDLYKAAILSSFIEAMEIHLPPAETQRVHTFIAHTSGEAIEAPLTEEDTQKNLESHFGTSSVKAISSRFKYQEDELKMLRNQLDTLFSETDCNTIEEVIEKYKEASSNLQEMSDFDSMINKFEENFSFAN
jgi:hypothetical protein